MDVLENPVYRFYRALWQGLDFIFPPDCGGCGEHGSRWCLKCEDSVLELLPPICEKCGRSIETGRICSRCRIEGPQYNFLRSWAVFTGPVRSAIHKLKYRRNIALGDTLARKLISFLLDLNWRVDLVIPVPLSHKRERERGYNQAALLAKPVSLAFQYPYKPQGLQRIRDTESQIDLTFQQRHQNVWGAFKANELIVRGKNVLLVDDVATSGATMNACASALKAGGVEEIYCVTLARTP